MDIWKRIWEILQGKNYQDSELRIILRCWCELLGRNDVIPIQREHIFRMLPDVLRRLKMETNREGKIFLLKILRCMLHPVNFSAEELNHLLAEFHIPYQYAAKENDFLFIGEFTDNTCKGQESNMIEDKSVMIQRKKRIFISHSSKDAEMVKAFVELLERLGIQEDEIVCSSIPPYCIPLGSKVYDWLAERIQYDDLHVIYMLSPNYYGSVACLNEMGAAWVTKQQWDGILLPGFSFHEIEGCIDRQICMKLDDNDRDTLRYRLGELKDRLAGEFELRSLSLAIWERYRDDFLQRIRNIAQGQESEYCEKYKNTY